MTSLRLFQNWQKKRVNVLLLQVRACMRFFIKSLIERNVNISIELNFSDVYQSVNYSVLLAKFT